MNYLTVTEVAQQLSLTTTTVYRLLRQGEIPSIRVGKTWRIPADYAKHLETHEPKNPSTPENYWHELIEALDVDALILEPPTPIPHNITTRSPCCDHTRWVTLAGNEVLWCDHHKKYTNPHFIRPELLPDKEPTA